MHVRNKSDIIYMSSYGEEIQHVLINEIDVDKEQHSNTTQQLIHELVGAPVVTQSRNSPHIAKCFGPFTNSKVKNSQSIDKLNCNYIGDHSTVLIIGY